MRDSILRKARESADLKLAFFEEYAEALEACAGRMAACFREGGRLLVMGNGGSACDADHIVVEFAHPVVEKRRALPALSLLHVATLTAVGNDTDYTRVFSQQLALLARPGDMVLGLSTSGASANVVWALKEAKGKGLLTLGFTGRDGGRMATLCDYCFIVRTWSTHRIQETHTALLHVLWDAVHVALGEEDVL